MTAGDSNNFYGDVVHMNGGTGNQGIVHHHASPAVEQALLAVLARVDALRGDLGPEEWQALDDARPALEAGDGVPDGARRSALRAIRSVAEAAGSIGQPLLDATRAALQLLGV
ncbi:hypothetical protein ACF09C_11200 [Streptomyces sp. NPDC014870]|uniref:hypothetical protein n=1 Tax=Streptomyces sp. NPDC014870 TaxID=3364925 RepID=UPI0036FE9C90